MTTRTIETREQYLLAAIEQVRPLFIEAGHPLPDAIKVSVGFGYSTRGESKHILAQAWAACTSDDGSNAVFVSPILKTADDALAALMHELVHVADDCVHGHGKVFGEIGSKIGLEGTKTQMLPGVSLMATLITIVEALGAYPHAQLDPNATRSGQPRTDDDEAARGGRVHTGPARQTGTRHIKAVCMTEICTARGYLVRLSQHWIDVAVPICPVCTHKMHVS
jgi:hypothetical protein